MSTLVCFVSSKIEDLFESASKIPEAEAVCENCKVWFAQTRHFYVLQFFFFHYFRNYAAPMAGDFLPRSHHFHIPAALEDALRCHALIRHAD